MLDLHAHVLPGIDDGPRTMDESLALLRAFVADGVSHVVATPHIYPGVFDNTWQGIAERFNELAQAIDHHRLPIGVSFAAEVRLCGEMIDWLHSGELPVMAGLQEGSFSVLVELPDGVVPVGAEALLQQMVRHGLTPIIAHPERNRAIMEAPAKAVALVRLGCKLQLTAGSLLGEFGERSAATALTLLESGAATLVASDAHNLRARRPRMDAARAWLTQRYGPETARALTDLNPMAVAGRAVRAVRGAEGLVLRELPVRFRSAARTNAGPVAWGLQDLPSSFTPPAAQSPLAAGRLNQEASIAEEGTALVPPEWLLPPLQDLGAAALFPDTVRMGEDGPPKEPWFDTIREEGERQPEPEFGLKDPGPTGSWMADGQVDTPAVVRTPPEPASAVGTPSAPAVPVELAAPPSAELPVLDVAVARRAPVAVPYLTPAAVGLALTRVDPASDVPAGRSPGALASAPGLLVK